jgi:hypothetical protein
LEVDRKRLLAREGGRALGPVITAAVSGLWREKDDTEWRRWGAGRFMDKCGD